MIQFRDIPASSDNAKKSAPPPTWPAGFPAFATESDVQALIKADWTSWWADVVPTYSTALAKPRQIGIRGLAHALALEQKNGWTFNFCLEFCQQHLIETSGGLAASLNIRELTTRGRSFVDEVLAGAAANAIAAEDGFSFQGDLGRMAEKHPGLVSRRWPGNGPDYLVGRATHGSVAEFRFIEAKGVAGTMRKRAPKNFYKFKAQSLNAELSNDCICKPILSYAYLPLPERPCKPRYGKPAPAPTSQAPIPMVVQWFNATERRPDESTPEYQRDSAVLLLTLARDQFHRLLRKSGVPEGVDMRPPQAPAFTRSSWRFPLRLRGDWYFVSQDANWAITVPVRAVRFFTRVGRLLDEIADLKRVDKIILQRLLAETQQLGQLADTRRLSSLEYYDVNNLRFEVLARDATGIVFLGRVHASPDGLKFR